MTSLLIVALTVQHVAYVVLLDRSVRSARQERADLLQRIQAPETAVYQHVVDTGTVAVSHLPFDDDGAFLSYQDEARRILKENGVE